MKIKDSIYEADVVLDAHSGFTGARFDYGLNCGFTFRIRLGTPKEVS